MLDTLLLRSSLHFILLHFTTLVDTSLPVIETSPNYTSLFGLTPFQFPTASFHLTSLHFTLLHYTSPHIISLHV